jgi:mRNA-degrading endonuclease RelE of RelBE toxin-antitoxin system
MDTFTTRPIEEIGKLDFKNILANKEIKVSPHATDHLSDNQRKVFKEEELIYMLEKEDPRKIYLQANGRYAAYYRKSDGYRKLILEVQETRITIVTFMDPLELPKYNLQNG